MGKKSSANAASKISSSSALTTAAATGSSNRSSILRSSFAPSSLQLHLFASVIQSFESQQVRIHDTSNGRLRQQHSVAAGTNVTCLDWGRYGQAYRASRSSAKKKRKRGQDSSEDIVVAYGTDKCDICMYSPAEDKIVATLHNGHDREVKDFRFNPADNLEAWSIGGDGRLVQWDLASDKVTRVIPLTDASVQTLSSPSSSLPQIVCASVTPYTIHIESTDEFRIDPFDAFKQPVHALFRSNVDGKAAKNLFIAADHSRYLNVYDVDSKKIVRTLVAGGDIQQAYVSQPVTEENQILLVVTREGTLELYSKPFELPAVLNGDVKSQRKQLTRKANATIKLLDPNNSKLSLPAFAASIDGPNVIIVSVDGGVDPVFQKLRWEDEGNGELLFNGVKEVHRAKSSFAANSTNLNGAKDMGTTHVQESRTVVVNGQTEPGSQTVPVEIESSEGEAEDVGSDSAEDETGEAVQSSSESDEEMADAEQEPVTADSIPAEQAEPSFGELLAAQHPEAISIADAIPGEEKSLAKLPEQALFQSGMSLGTVLTQSLRTNDQSLLETCLHVTDEQIIRSTILRLDSALAANLLTKLAERLSDRPGRYGHLLTWVQSTMVAHGGSIASQAGVASKLRTLYQVLNERSKILPSILLLKGKLDMMNAQQEYRAQAAARRNRPDSAPGVIYIEGGDDNWSSDEDMDEAPRSKTTKNKSKPRKDLPDLIAAPESSDDEGMPLTNGGYHTEDDDEEESGDEAFHSKQPNGIIDDEADVSGGESEDVTASGTDQSGDDEDEEDGDEEDSEMEDFINDGEISEVEDDGGIDLDDEPEKPAKKSKHR